MAKFSPAKLKSYKRPSGMPFNITKIGHVVLNCTDIERSAKFYTEVMGFKISDVYGPDIAPGGMVFLRYNADHHGVALVGKMPGESHGLELNHLAFEVGTLDEVLRARDHLKKHKVEIDFEGRRRAGVQIAVEFKDPDGHLLEIYWGLDQIGSDGIVRPAKEWIWAHTLEEAIENPVRNQDTSLQEPKLLQKRSRAQVAKLKARSMKTQTEKLGKKK